MVASQIFGWSFQFIGHGLYEKRAPAISTNLFNIIVAPLFVVYEVLEILFDFEKERTVEYKKIAEADIAYYRIKKGYPMREGIKIKNFI